MSTTKETTIWCDSEGCCEWIQVCERSDKGARASAARQTRPGSGGPATGELVSGWRTIARKDYCPTCVKVGGGS